VRDQFGIRGCLEAGPGMSWGRILGYRDGVISAEGESVLVPEWRPRSWCGCGSSGSGTVGQCRQVQGSRKNVCTEIYAEITKKCFCRRITFLFANTWQFQWPIIKFELGSVANVSH
jgi:hypothetical protein